MTREDEVVAAATQVFLRYGYKRTTMGDLAEAAQLSRPALYLVFPSKEEVFTAVMAGLLQGALAEIRAGLQLRATPREKLSFAFEVWSVRPFELMLSSPDARDLYESSYQFAAAVMIQSSERFVALIAQLLLPLARRGKVGLSAVQLAQMLAGAIPGFKTVARSSAQFRELIDDLITVVLASLGVRETKRPRRR